jgi:quinol-cytochrome oxidoreductase complex cytochrome b subunit
MSVREVAMLGLYAPVVDLNGQQRVLEWGWFHITVANLVVVGLLVLVFALAVALPFPKGIPAKIGPSAPVPAAVAERGWTDAIRRWIKRRLPWEKLLPSAEPTYVRSWTYYFGVGTLSSLAIIVISGTTIAIGGPTWRHVSSIGVFVDDVHLWAVQLFFFFMILHLTTKLMNAAWRGRRRTTWVIGSLAMLVSFAAALTGYVCQQNFEAQWIATQSKDGLNAVGIGGFLNVLNTGQMLTVHIVVLPLAVVLLVTVHILLVRLRGVCPPPAVPEKKDVRAALQPEGALR